MLVISVSVTHSQSSPSTPPCTHSPTSSPLSPLYTRPCPPLSLQPSQPSPSIRPVDSHPLLRFLYLSQTFPHLPALKSLTHFPDFHTLHPSLIHPVLNSPSTSSFPQCTHRWPSSSPQSTQPEAILLLPHLPHLVPTSTLPSSHHASTHPNARLSHPCSPPLTSLLSLIHPPRPPPPFPPSRPVLSISIY